ncbi:CRISPR-associated endonuclease/helicase Cas3 [Synergistales bacterium]|nr:CRISPR-associated endonuclease/helicase Cas3 [Synergistales bacterium]
MASQKISHITEALWAKSNPRKSLITHMLETGHTAQVLLEEGALRPVLPLLADWLSLTLEQTLSLVGYIAGLHDIGKAHPMFQVSGKEDFAQVLWEEGLLHKSVQKGEFRHEKYSARILKEIWKTDTPTNEEISEMLRAAIALHHQGKNGASAEIPKNRKPTEWRKMQEEIESVIREEFKPPLEALTRCVHYDAAAMTLMGVVILADWIASGADFSTNDISLRDTVLEVIEDYGLRSQKSFPCYENFCDLFTEFQPSHMRELQKACEELDKNAARLVVIEAPMGEGKTEAALYLTSHMIKNTGKTGFYIAMPTAATGNQMYFRMEKLLKEHGAGDARLMHGMAWIVEEAQQKYQSNIDDSDDSDAANDWLRPLRKAMLGQYGVGTVDQTMMAAMTVKYGVLRLLGLMGKTLIIDEVHAYDTYMNTIIERLLEWCGALKIPVVLLSATLPAKKKENLLKSYGARINARLSSTYPLITVVNEDKALNEISVAGVHMKREFHIHPQNILGDIQATANFAFNLAEKGGCVCVMLNTVKRAQEVYKALREMRFGGTLKLFHARFLAEDRQRIEDEAVLMFGKNAGNSRPKSAILVCTQVVEQSLDLDFDLMITELAPIDLLLQRLGRLCRHDGTKRPDWYSKPNAHVLLCPCEKYKTYLPMYEPLTLRRTQALLERSDVLSIPSTMREMIEYVYSGEARDEDLSVEAARKAFKEALEGGNAEAVTLPEPHADYAFITECDDLFGDADDESALFRAVKTRLSEPSLRVALVPEEWIEQAKKAPHDRETSKKILQKSVSLRMDSVSFLTDDTERGEGLLRDCRLLPMQDNSYYCENREILYNEELGVEVQSKAR